MIFDISLKCDQYSFFISLRNMNILSRVSIILKYMKDKLFVDSLEVVYEKLCPIVLCIFSPSGRIILYFNLMSKLDIRFQNCFNNKFHQDSTMNVKVTQEKIDSYYFQIFFFICSFNIITSYSQICQYRSSLYLIFILMTQINLIKTL